MDQKNVKKTSFIVLQLLLVAVLINMPSRTSGALVRPPLGSSFYHAGLWQGYDVPIAEEVVGVLQLDDYLSRTYRKDDGTIDLYIGYYRSSKKTAASHSPLVCFPGQGWVISGEKRTPMLSKEFLPDGPVHGTLMTVKREGMEMRIFFWFQAWTRTYPSTFEQKLSLLWDRIQLGVEDNALVRVSARMNASSSSDADALIEDFLRAFYPLWYDYLNSVPR